MRKQLTRQVLLTSTIVAGVLAISTPAFGQTTPQAATPEAATPDDGGETIVVTGSRITRPDLVSSSPVAVISAAELRMNNTVTVEQLLTVNPQFQPGGTSASNNPGDGAATVDLRGLGANRTLVLIDGKRAPYYDTTAAVDINSIPTALIKRIDILTGGASSVYGSDADAGVVNFILDDRFTGLRFDGSAQISGEGDAGIYDASLTGGVALGDRGNIVVSAGYSKRNTVRYGDRVLNSQVLDPSDLSPSGSSNTIPTAFDTGNDPGRLQVQPDGSLSANVVPYNYQAVNYAQIPIERYNIMALGRYELSDNVELYARANYQHTETLTNLAPTATAGFFFNIDPANPFLTTGERAAFFNANATINDGSGVASDPTARAGTSVIGIRRRIVETGGRTELHKTQSYQFVSGLRGDVGGGAFHYDVFAQYGRVQRNEILKNDLSYTALQQGLDVVTGPGGAQCKDTSNGCVPLNLFVVGTIPQNQLAFVLRDAKQDTVTEQFVTGANISGDIGFLKSPGAEKPAAFSFGVEYRNEKGATVVDSNYASGDLIYYGQGQNIKGKYNVKEAYIEVKMPLIQDKPFFQSFNVEAGYRYSDYSSVGSVASYKGGADWTPVSGLRFRGIYQRAVRAPNLFELYAPVVAATGSLTVDPCQLTLPVGNATTTAICIAQGAPASSIGSIPKPVAGQINIFSGGFPGLKAEKSNTLTFGAVVSPPSLRGLSFSVDYYKISINNAIDQVSPTVTVNQCFNVDKVATSTACSSIKRNTLDGTISGPIQFGLPSVYGNISVIKTEGLDFAADYHSGNSNGLKYGLSVAATYIINYSKRPDPLAGINRCDGTFGGACNLEPMPKWKHTADFMLGFDNISLTTRWRYLGAVHEDAQTDILVSRISPKSYIDQTVAIEVNKAFELRLGVQNLFNVKPPIIGDNISDNVAGSTYPNTYDVIGRSFFAAVSAKF